MKAIVHSEYGSAEVLKFEEIERPVPNDNQVLVKVRAASLNPADGHFLRAPFPLRLMTGLRKPKDIRVGVDLAGRVEAIGSKATQFKPGDEVFGAAARGVLEERGSLAEYVCAPEAALVIKPDNMTFEQAAAVPVAGLTALQGLRNKGKIQPEQKVLINGASGGVGTFAVQIAKAFGAEVTGVCSTKNVDLVRSIGADHVIDYTEEDFTKGAERYDLIYDLVGNHSFSDRRRALIPHGICVLAGIGGAGQHPESLARVAGTLKATLLSHFVNQKFVMFVSKATKEDLTLLRDLMQSGKMTPVIDRTYPLDNAADALRYLEQGHACGKVVITLD